MILANSKITQLASDAVTVLNPKRKEPLLFLCEHAGAEIPGPWKTLGLPPAFFDTHFAYDKGAAEVTNFLAHFVNATAILSRYSRIFLDYNRYPDDWEKIRPDLGGIPVPGNTKISEVERNLRYAIAEEPVKSTILRHLPGLKAIISIHSFSPVMAGKFRDVDIGILWKQNTDFVKQMTKAISKHSKLLDLRVAENEPYDWRFLNAYTLEAHAIANGLPCCVIEINSKLLSDPKNTQQIGQFLGDALKTVIVSNF